MLDVLLYHTHNSLQRVVFHKANVQSAKDCTLVDLIGDDKIQQLQLLKMVHLSLADLDNFILNHQSPKSQQTLKVLSKRFCSRKFKGAKATDAFD